jgi:hypothetical protein
VVEWLRRHFPSGSTQGLKRPELLRRIEIDLGLRISTSTLLRARKQTQRN